MSEDFEIGIWTAGIGFLGVLVGGAITYFIQWHFVRAEEKKRGRVQLVRIQFLVNFCTHHIIQVGRALRRTIPVGHTGPLWPIVLPIITPEHAPVDVPVEDLAVLKGEPADEFVNTLAEVTRIHNLVYATLGHFNSLRTQLRDMVAPLSEISMDSNSASVEFDSRQHPQIMAVIHECESLIETLMRLTENGTMRSQKLVELFNANAENSKGRISGKRVPRLVMDADTWRLGPIRR